MSPEISTAEHKILLLLADGLGNKGICARSGLSVKTVKNHLYKIYKKLGVQSRSAAVAQAFRRGIVT